MWEDPNKADGRRTRLKSFYYIMNNLISSTLNPKDNATDLNGYITNVLSRFPNGEKFNMPRFMWVELGFAMDDGRRDLPYAPYLMFLIERVTGLRYLKDGFHQAYKIKKTLGGAAPTHRASSSFDHEDLPEGPCSRSRRSGSWKRKISSWMKAMFGKCSYAVERAYDTQREQRELRGQHLPTLPPVPSPPVYYLPNLSDTDDDNGDDQGETSESEEQQLFGSYDDPDLQETLYSFYRSQRQTGAGPSTTIVPP
jgi:hypothetical protein